MAINIATSSCFFLYLSNYLKTIFKQIDGIIHTQQDFSYLSEFQYDIPYRLVVEDKKELGSSKRKIHSIYFSVYEIISYKKMLKGISKFLVINDNEKKVLDDKKESSSYC